jgi:transposase
LGLPGYQITGTEEVSGEVRIGTRYTGPVHCIHCGSGELRTTRIELETCKWHCRSCGRFFWQRFPGILPQRRATEPFQRSVFVRHWDGISRNRPGKRERISGATVERWFEDYLRREAAEKCGAPCPEVLGIDEHFFTRKLGYATTFCDLKNHRVHDVVLGRSEAALEGCLGRLAGKHLVKVVCMDLAAGYRSIDRKHFPQARIVADRFHVIRVINHHFLASWKDLDPAGSKNRGLLSLMRRHRHNLTVEQHARLSAYLREKPALELIYRFKQKLCSLLKEKHLNQRKCRELAPWLLRMIAELRDAGLAPLVQLGNTLHSWRDEIATMWRFTRNNGITEGFHTKMEVLQRQAYGFRNFQNYRLRVKVMCS